MRACLHCNYYLMSLPPNSSLELRTILNLPQLELHQGIHLTHFRGHGSPVISPKKRTRILFLWQNIWEDSTKKDLFWLMVTEISAQGHLAPLPLGLWWSRRLQKELKLLTFQRLTAGAWGEEIEEGKGRGGQGREWKQVWVWLRYSSKDHTLKEPFLLALPATLSFYQVPVAVWIPVNA